MCGIVGYLGPQNPKDIIIQGLKKLEYRGYDSAGLAVFDQNTVKRVRAEGKLKNLEEKIKGETFTGHLGIGHTRWATHGVPSENNAHPHQAGKISLVHNGIIENYLEIREELKAAGAKIQSDTDSELVAHLVSQLYEQSQDLLGSVQKILSRLRGAFSILVIANDRPDELVAFKDGPPLVVGLGEKQNFVVSDVQAALAHTKNFVYLEDREIVAIKGADVKFYNSLGETINKPVITLNWSSEQIEKQGYSHFMLKEIYEQPGSLAATLAPHIVTLRARSEVQLFKVGFGSQPQQLESLNAEADWAQTQKILVQFEKIYIVACGTSFYAGSIGKYFIEQLAQISCEIDIASEFRYRQPVLNSKTLVLTISQSGETADTLAAIRLAKEKGAHTLSICNVKNSTIDREAHGHLYLNAGPEVGVASTKAFTSMVTLLNLFALALAKSRKLLSSQTEEEHIHALQQLPAQIEVVLGYDKYFAKAAEQLKAFKGFLYMGRGVNFPVAMEGALKLKELAYYHAEGYAAGEMKHGPLALIDEKMAIVMIVPDDNLFEKSVSNLEEAKARGGKIISVGTGENARLKSISDRYLSIPKAHWSTNPILATVPLQLMAFHLADSLGYDVDQPRNLAKSVTVE
ncbi:MAG: glutamine--fructose-6-phosphate transaminase (isomerizing) [Proteobacteria bacterium]|jgi:glucosamine--fructose-6-phosphate aminotransferase (isomerizing)|nr:glutamine--fructose-6-phosphate transaminase (isomerizing) [Pseudomonadota bacterium]